MSMIQIGIISPSEIAFRRFLPALRKLSNFKYMGVAVANKEEWLVETENEVSYVEKILKAEREKASSFVEANGGKIFESYKEMITSKDIDAIYLPLPPSLHYEWAKLALQAGKHVLIEKPATTSIADTADLIHLANENNLAIHENYMFIFHEQLNAINNIIKSGKIGDVRLYRVSFGFPKRPANDFRYNKKLGGGALLDCGGYTIKYASLLLGGQAKIVCAQSNHTDDSEVDIYGSATLVNDKGTTVQISFGMDNSYKCDLEVWGSLGCLTSGRVLTAPAGYTPSATFKNGTEIQKISLPSDDAFRKSILHFQKCIEGKEVRKSNFQEILKQTELLESFKNKSLTK